MFVHGEPKDYGRSMKSMRVCTGVFDCQSSWEIIKMVVGQRFSFVMVEFGPATTELEALPRAYGPLYSYLSGYSGNATFVPHQPEATANGEFCCARAKI